MESPIILTISFNDTNDAAKITGTFTKYKVSRELIISKKEYKSLTMLLPISNVINSFVHEIIIGTGHETDAKILIHNNLHELNQEIQKINDAIKRFDDA